MKPGLPLRGTGPVTRTVIQERDDDPVISQGRPGQGPGDVPRVMALQHLAPVAPAAVRDVHLHRLPAAEAGEGFTHFRFRLSPGVRPPRMPCLSS